jgi:thiol:disulfide interchange protein DsbA
MRPISKILLTTAFSVFTLSACMSEENATEKTANEAAVTDAAAATENSTATTSPETAAATAVVEEETVAPRPAFIEGQHYTVLATELPTEAPAGQVEVAELFWYGCPHCYHLEPSMKAYIKEKADNVYFRRIPATLNPNWTVQAKAYYMGEILDADGAKNVHDAIFAAIHEQRRRLNDDEAMKRFFVTQGFSEEAIDKAANSMEVQAKLKTATDYSTASKATGVPTLIVAGKYMTSPTMAQGSAKLKRVLAFLAEKATEK